MTWTESATGAFTATDEGLNFVLEPVSWSIWSLEQAKDSARYLADQKRCGANPWVPGCQVKLYYRPEGLDTPPPIKVRGRRKPDSLV
jgi:hypothetical protein